MTLSRRLLMLGCVAALPVAFLTTTVVDRLRMADLQRTLENVVTLQINDQVKERCEADPVWFLTGSLENRPRPTDPKPTDPDAVPARPRNDAHPYELFAYDDEFTGSSPVAPRFPIDMRNALRAGAISIAAPFDTPDGTGAQYAVRTGWIGGPCQAWLARMRPWPDQRLDWWLIFFGTAGLVVGVVAAVTTHDARRIRALSIATRSAAKSDWTVTVPADGHDELTSVGAAFNEASADLRRRIGALREHDEALRRFLARLAVEVAGPLQGHETHLSESAQHAVVGGPDLAGIVSESHDLALHFGNLLVAAGLRLHIGVTAREPVTLNAIVERVRARCQGLARVGGVGLEAIVPTTPVVTPGDAMLFEQALANLVDNAIRFNRPGGHVRVALTSQDGGFSIVVSDDGIAMTDEKLTEVTAIRRFRGDEGRADRARQRGLGLAVVWEIAESFGLQFTIRRAPDSTGIEATLGGPSA